MLGNVEKIDVKYLVGVPNWRNNRGETRYQEVKSINEKNIFATYKLYLISDLDTKTEFAKKILKEIPYSAIVPLNHSLYGEGLYLGQRAERVFQNEREFDVYDILTEDGVVIGRFTHDFFEELIAHRAFVITNYSEISLPRDMFKDDSKESFDEIVSNYCASFQNATKHISSQTYEKFPKLPEMIKEKIESRKSPTKTERTQELLQKSRTKSDGGKA